MALTWQMGMDGEGEGRRQDSSFFSTANTFWSEGGKKKGGKKKVGE